MDLENSVKNFNLNIINRKGYVEIKPNGINKGAFASFILSEEILKKERLTSFSAKEMILQMKKCSNFSKEKEIKSIITLR